MTRRQAHQLCIVSFILGSGLGILAVNDAPWWLTLIYGLLSGATVSEFIHHWTPRRKRAPHA